MVKNSRNNESTEEADDIFDIRMDLGATSASLTDDELIMNNPHFKRLLNKFFNKHIQDVKRNGKTSGSELISKITSPQINSEKRQQSQGRTALIKSPSDTTIYASVLHRGFRREGVNDLNVEELIRESNKAQAMRIMMNMGSDNQTQAEKMNNDAINHISTFIDQMRVAHDEDELDTEQQENHPKSRVNAPGLQEAQKRMEHAIVETEKFKATGRICQVCLYHHS